MSGWITVGADLFLQFAFWGAILFAVWIQSWLPMLSEALMDVPTKTLRARSFVLVLAFACSWLCTAADSSERSPSEVVNVTVDSEPGWVPSAEQRAGAPEILDKYLRALDGAQYEQAYGYLSDIFRQHTDFATFQDRANKFNALAGSVRAREIVAINWTKNPAHSPALGVYAAIDLVSKFDNIDRHCGYVVLYQAAAGGRFSVMREEQNYIDNASAQKLQREQSSDSLQKTWAQLVKNCPNYKPAEVALPPIPETSGALPYKMVAEALADIKARPGAEVNIAQPSGWTIISFKNPMEIWSFAPVGHYSYPSAVRRAVRESPEKRVYIDMAVLCEADKVSCDKLVREFQELNNRAAESKRKNR